MAHGSTQMDALQKSFSARLRSRRRIVRRLLAAGDLPRGPGLGALARQRRQLSSPRTVDILQLAGQLDDRARPPLGRVRQVRHERQRVGKVAVGRLAHERMRHLRHDLDGRPVDLHERIEPRRHVLPTVGFAHRPAAQQQHAPAPTDLLNGLPSYAPSAYMTIRFWAPASHVCSTTYSLPVVPALSRRSNDVGARADELDAAHAQLAPDLGQHFGILRQEGEHAPAGSRPRWSAAGGRGWGRPALR